jgi:hypothetical protein
VTCTAKQSCDTMLRWVSAQMSFAMLFGYARVV